MSARAPDRVQRPKRVRVYRAPRLVLYGSVVEPNRASPARMAVIDELGGVGMMGMGFFKSG